MSKNDLDLFYGALHALLDYAVDQQLLEPRDRAYTANRLLELYGLDSLAPGDQAAFRGAELPRILEVMLDEATTRSLIPTDSPAARERFDARLMGLLMPPPSVIEGRFYQLFDGPGGPEAATDAYFHLSRASHYIKDERTALDLRWQTDTPWGRLDITINRSKPEKDPRDIAAAGKAAKSGYPACLLCAENEGYAGHQGHPARQNHRIIRLPIQGNNWFMQYSPYVYYNEHCIFLHADHHAMKIDKACFERLTEIIGLLPHYFVGSNADLPIVGGSILAHEHFQGGRFVFAMERADIDQPVELASWPEVKVGWVRWPLSVLRLTSTAPAKLVDLADRILTDWRSFSDPEAGIFAETEGEKHNTITPIARRRGEAYELDLVLRNNRTDEDHPLGIFHPRSTYHHIKKENIGLIEVMGLAVLPARLAVELKAVEERLLAVAGKGEAVAADLERGLREDPLTSSHAEWAMDFISRRGLLEGAELDPAEAEAIVREETGQVFGLVLEDAGVYKWDEKGILARGRYTAHLQEVLR